MILHIAKLNEIMIGNQMSSSHIPSLLIIGIFSGGMNCAKPYIMVWVKKRVYVAYIPWDRLLDFVTG
jgi:hypothetical protein